MLTRDATDEQISRACAELRGAGAVPSTFATDPAASEELLLWFERTKRKWPETWVEIDEKVQMIVGTWTAACIITHYLKPASKHYVAHTEGVSPAHRARMRCIAVLRAAGRME